MFKKFKEISRLPRIWHIWLTWSRSLYGLFSGPDNRNTPRDQDVHSWRCLGKCWCIWSVDFINSCRVVCATNRVKQTVWENVIQIHFQIFLFWSVDEHRTILYWEARLLFCDLDPWIISKTRLRCNLLCYVVSSIAAWWWRNKFSLLCFRWAFFFLCCWSSISSKPHQ